RHRKARRPVGERGLRPVPVHQEGDGRGGRPDRGRRRRGPVPDRRRSGRGPGQVQSKRSRGEVTSGRQNAYVLVKGLVGRTRPLRAVWASRDGTKEVRAFSSEA